MTNTIVSNVVWLFMVVFPPESGFTPTFVGETSLAACQQAREDTKQATSQHPGIKVSDCIGVTLTKLPNV